MNQSNIIKPTIGRKVWFFIDHLSQRRDAVESVHVSDSDPSKPMDASVADVHDAKPESEYDFVTISFADHDGFMHRHTAPFRQPGQERPNAREWCEWMPYQIGQAAKEAVVRPHQQRVVAEKAELDDKRGKLFTFMNSKNFFSLCDEAERNRMDAQANAMARYSEALESRIAAFTQVGSTA